MCSTPPSNGLCTATGRSRPAAPPRRRSPAHSTANAACSPSALGEHVGEQALGQPAAVERDARRPADDAASSVEGDAPPARAAARARPGAARGASRSASGERQRRARGRRGSPRPRSRAAASRRRARRSARAASATASTRRPMSGLTGTSAPRVGVEARELAGRDEAAEARRATPGAAGGRAADSRRGASSPRVDDDRAGRAEAGEGVDRSRSSCGLLTDRAGRGRDGVPRWRTISRTKAGTTTMAVATMNHVSPASVPSPNECARPASQASAVRRCSFFQRCWPMRSRT